MSCVAQWEQTPCWAGVCMSLQWWVDTGGYQAVFRGRGARGVEVWHSVWPLRHADHHTGRHLLQHQTQGQLLNATLTGLLGPVRWEFMISITIVIKISKNIQSSALNWLSSVCYAGLISCFVRTAVVIMFSCTKLHILSVWIYSKSAVKIVLHFKRAVFYVKIYCKMWFLWKPWNI